MKRVLTIVCGIVATISATGVQADCATRIEAVKAHPSILVVEPSKSDADVTVKQGGADVAVKEGGGVTKYKSEGPALPRENWFGSKPELSAVLAHLASAEDALKVGKMKECNDKISAAEKILSKPQN